MHPKKKIPSLCTLAEMCVCVFFFFLKKNLHRKGFESFTLYDDDDGDVDDDVILLRMRLMVLCC